MKKLVGLIPWLGGGIFSAGLLLYTYLGIYNRFWADDWCYNADFVTLGFWGTVKGYTFITHYASNRYSLTFFTMALQLMGVFSAQITALLVVLLMFGGLLLVLHGFNRLFKLAWSPLLLFFATVAIEYYSLYIAPNQYRSLFFRSSVMTYTAPLIAFVYVFGLLLRQLDRDKPSTLLAVAVAPLAFIAGGFSEGGCAYLGMALGILWLATLVYRMRGHAWARRIFVPVSAALVAAILALLLLVLSPANALRHAGYPEPTAPWLLPFLSVRYTIDFIRESLSGLLIPHAMFSLLFLLLPFLAKKDEQASISFTKSGIVMLIFAVGAILLIAAAQIPAIYIEKGPPATKALISARFFLLFAMAGIFWLAGNWLAQRTGGIVRYAALALILIPILYTVRPILLTTQELPRYIERAGVWDARDRSIRQAAEQGVREIDVKGIDSAYLGHTLDFKEKPTFWTNACAETYYGMDEIRATLP